MWNRWLVFIVGVAAAGCVESKTTLCGLNTCPQNYTCSPDGARCVVEAQLIECEGKAEGDGCSFPGEPSGSCSGGVCLPVGCGNGVVESQLGEICDDGNRNPTSETLGDTCAADCRSEERCGDGVVTGAEQCDCGDGAVSVANCSGANSDSSGATCRTDCTLARCGDNLPDPGEACDDGNNTPGDGCRADCTGRWTQMQTPSFAELNAVFGTSPTNVVAVGDGGVLLHYDGVSWTQKPPPAGSTVDYKDVWGVGSDFYAVGNVTNASDSRLDRFNGTAWSSMLNMPSTYVTAIHGRSASDFWIAGSTSASTLYLRRWTGTLGAASTCSGVTSFGSLWADQTSAAVWAANDNGMVCTFNGTSWTPATTPSLTVETVFGLSANDIYGVNDNGNPVAWHSAGGTTWTPVTEANGLEGVKSIGGVVGDVILVGERGRIGVFDGTTWKGSLSPTSLDLIDVWGYAPKRAFIVGGNGAILY
jgi:cysteine-rich repeat protein